MPNRTAEEALLLRKVASAAEDLRDMLYTDARVSEMAAEASTRHGLQVTDHNGGQLLNPVGRLVFMLAASRSAGEFMIATELAWAHWEKVRTIKEAIAEEVEAQS